MLKIESYTKYACACAYASSICENSAKGVQGFNRANFGKKFRWQICWRRSLRFVLKFRPRGDGLSRFYLRFILNSHSKLSSNLKLHDEDKYHAEAPWIGT